jgi:flagellar biogenesis protein FliO
VPWLCLQLRDDAALTPSIEKEFALFKEMQQEETQRMFRRARAMKIVAAIVVLVVFVLVAVWVVTWMKMQGARSR